MSAQAISANNRRIAKNTLMLYVRMAFTMALSIFTTRILLSALGVNDFGLVGVIGGIVTMFAFLSGMMSTSCSRYLNFELGRKDFVRLKQTFNLFQLIFAVLIVILLVLSETVGLWFFETKLTVAPDRVSAAFWFYQFSVATFLLGIMTVPYMSLVISHENMKAYSVITVFEAAARLGIVYLLSVSSFDKLAFYGALLMIVGIIHLSLYVIVCRHNYAESRLSFYWEKRYFLELVAFGGWNLFGAAANLFTNVFVNVLLNNYFGPAISAARSVGQQISGAVTSFTSNFLTATRPQVIKYYAAGDLTQSHLLTMRASRISFFLLFFIALPAFLLMPFVLELWLREIPPHTLWFARLMLIKMLIDSFSFPLMTQAQASGKVALYQSVVGMTLWLTLPAAWLVMHFTDFPPESIIGVMIAISLVCMVLRLVLVRRCAKLSVRAFVKNVFVPALTAGAVACIAPVCVAQFCVPAPGWTQFFIVGFTSVFCCVPAFAFLGFTRPERTAIFALARSKIPAKFFPKK